jgi:hypothetical protein
MSGHLGKQHSSVTLELRCQSALRAHVRHSTLRSQDLSPPCIWRIPEQAPTPQYSDTLLEGGR